MATKKHTAPVEAQASRSRAVPPPTILERRLERVAWDIHTARSICGLTARALEEDTDEKALVEATTALMHAEELLERLAHAVDPAVFLNPNAETAAA